MKSGYNIAKSVFKSKIQYRKKFIEHYFLSQYPTGLHKNTPMFLKKEFIRLDNKIKNKSWLTDEIKNQYLEGLNYCNKQDYEPYEKQPTEKEYYITCILSKMLLEIYNKHFLYRLQRDLIPIEQNQIITIFETNYPSIKRFRGVYY